MNLRLILLAVLIPIISLIVALIFYPDNSSDLKDISIEPNKKAISIENLTLSKAFRVTYYQKLQPLEKASDFHIFSPPMNYEDFETRPKILLVGQHQTGKTSFISYLIGEDYPGAEIGPEPKSHEFLIVMNGKKRNFHANMIYDAYGIIDFKNLDKILPRCKLSMLPNRIVESLIFIDTPGFFNQEYDQYLDDFYFINEIKSFASQSDRILFLIHPNDKIHGMMQRYIEVVTGHDDKVRFIINKASSFEKEHLLEVVRELQENLTTILKKPEIPQIYIGSFKKGTEDKLGDFRKDQEFILNDLAELPNKKAKKILNDFTQRVKQVLMHVYVIKEIQKKTPQYINDINKNLNIDLIEIVDKIKTEFPILEDCKYDVNKMKVQLSSLELSSIKIGENLINHAKSILENDMRTLQGLSEDVKNVTFMVGQQNNNS